MPARISPAGVPKEVEMSRNLRFLPLIVVTVRVSVKIIIKKR